MKRLRPTSLASAYRMLIAEIESIDIQNAGASLMMFSDSTTEIVDLINELKFNIDYEMRPTSSQLSWLHEFTLYDHAKLHTSSHLVCACMLMNLEAYSNGRLSVEAVELITGHLVWHCVRLNREVVRHVTEYLYSVSKNRHLQDVKHWICAAAWFMSTRKSSGDQMDMLHNSIDIGTSTMSIKNDMPGAFAAQLWSRNMRLCLTRLEYKQFAPSGLTGC